MNVTLSEKLVCVRYRYDKVRNRRYKTVELIGDEVSWTPKEAVRNGPAHRKSSDLVGVRIDYHEVELREEVKAIGGIWRPSRNVGAHYSLGYRAKAIADPHSIGHTCQLVARTDGNKAVDMYLPIERAANQNVAITDAHSAVEFVKSAESFLCPLSANNEPALLRALDSIESYRHGVDLLCRLIVHDAVVVDLAALATLYGHDRALRESYNCASLVRSKKRLRGMTEEEFSRTQVHEFLSITQRLSLTAFHIAPLASLLPFRITVLSEELLMSAAQGARRFWFDHLEQVLPHSSELRASGFGLDKEYHDKLPAYAGNIARSDVGPERTLFYLQLSSLAQAPLVLHPERSALYQGYHSEITDAYSKILERLRSEFGQVEHPNVRSLCALSRVDAPQLPRYLVRIACRDQISLAQAAAQIRDTRAASGFRRWLAELQVNLMDGSLEGMFRAEKQLKKLDEVVKAWNEELDVCANITYRPRTLSLAKAPGLNWLAALADSVSLRDPILNPKPYLMFVSSWYSSPK